MMSGALPVSRKLLRPDRTSGQPLEMPLAISEPAFNWSCTTSSRTTPPIGAMLNVTREYSDGLASFSGLAQLITSRPGGWLSSTLPTILTLPSWVTCCHFEPTFQSEILALLQYWRANSGVVMASHTFCGVLVI